MAHHKHTHNHHGHAHDHNNHHHGPGHNHSHDHADHLHSHVHGDTNKNRTEELKVLATSFVENFRTAEDKTSYLRLAGIPFQRKGGDGLTMSLVDTAINANWQIGTASPAFASRELVYMPFPGNMISHREIMTFTYVSLTQREDVDLLTLLEDKLEQPTESIPHEH